MALRSWLPLQTDGGAAGGRGTRPWWLPTLLFSSLLLAAVTFISPSSQMDIMSAKRILEGLTLSWSWPSAVMLTSPPP